MNELIYKQRYNNIFRFYRDESLFIKHKREYALLYGCNLFDKTYYLQEYIDVKMSGEDPLLHYISIGHRLNYNPSAEFDTHAYKIQFMKNTEDMYSPLYHYYFEGLLKECHPIPVKNTTYYYKFPRRQVERHNIVQKDFDLYKELVKSSLRNEA